MSNVIRTHRGPQTYMTLGTGKNLVLQEGEIFVEFPDAGIGTAGSKIKVGDGISAYSALPYIASGDAPKSAVICMSKKRYLISADNWSNSKDYDGYFSYTVTLDPELDPGFQPNVYVTGVNDNTFATAAQKTAFRLLKDELMTDSDTLTLYAEEKPDIDFYVFIEGKEFDSGIIDLYFDPVTHTATEENFIRFLDLGLYTKKVVGYKVILSNEAATTNYNGGIWVIADVGHDSLNQPKSYDLIAEEAFGTVQFETNDTGNRWRDSTLRTWLNGEYRNGFSSALRNYMIRMVYQSFDGSDIDTYNDDFIILPSAAEIGLSDGEVTVEGTKYPIFTDNASRTKNTFGTVSSPASWWVRSNTDTVVRMMYIHVNINGSALTKTNYPAKRQIAPLMRVSNCYGR